MEGTQKSPMLKTPYTVNPTMLRDRKSKFNPITLKSHCWFHANLFGLLLKAKFYIYSYIWWQTKKSSKRYTLINSETQHRLCKKQISQYRFEIQTFIWSILINAIAYL